MANRKDTTKPRGYPDRRGLWAESDPVSEIFVPSERYKAQQKAMAETLGAAGLSPEQVANMLLVPEYRPAGENLTDEDRTQEKKPQEP
jgi:hypothetical protein